MVEERQGKHQKGQNASEGIDGRQGNTADSRGAKNRPKNALVPSSPLSSIDDITMSKYGKNASQNGNL